MLHLALFIQLGLSATTVPIKTPALQAVTIAGEPRDPGKEITDDPHGPDPHGGGPHDEIHDPKLPANDPSRNPLRNRDAYGNPT